MFGVRKLESMAIVWSCLFDPRFSHLCRTPTCDRQTDGQTDGRTDTRTHDDNIYRASIASLGKNKVTSTTLSVGHVRESCKNHRTDRDDICGLTWVGLKNHY